MATKNPFGKTRPVDRPYAVVYGANGWRYDILKLYKGLESSRKDPYARAFCNVHGFETEMGDVYLRDIPGAFAALEKALAPDGSYPLR